MIIGGKTIKNDNAAAAMKLYGEIFSGTILILTVTALVRKSRRTLKSICKKPEKICQHHTDSGGYVCTP